MQYSLDEIVICASQHPVDIEHRSEIKPYDENGKLPIFVSPMTCVLNESNFDVFKKSKVIPILPRNTQYAYKREDWVALSLNEFEYLLSSDELDLNGYHILVDIANGHMKKLYDLANEAKTKYPDLVLMIGNIDNQYIYKDCCKAGIDYVRVGVGGGSVCDTSRLTGIHQSLPYLLTQIKVVKSNMIADGYKGKFTKIIADGGITTIDKAVKCLALGADYVMMGNMFARCKEACGEIVANDGIKQYRSYYGMASEQGQIDISGGVHKEPEGSEMLVPVEFELNQLLKTFESALRSAMSYTGHKTLKEFHNSFTDIQSITEFNNYYRK